MIDVSTYRMRIGRYQLVTRGTATNLGGAVTIAGDYSVVAVGFIAAIISILLIIGCVEQNPGPFIGDTLKEDIKFAKDRGLYLFQTTFALKTLLRHLSNVHVVYSKELGVLWEHNNKLIAKEIAKHKQFDIFVFPYAINMWHQIAITLKNNTIVVTDSLGKSLIEAPAIKNLASLLGIEHTKLGQTNYLNQDDDWSCGVHTVRNLIDIVEENKLENKSKLDVDGFLPDILMAAEEYRIIDIKEQDKQDERRLHKYDILDDIEDIRKSEGTFDNPDSKDALRAIADQLQMEMWGNVDRHLTSDRQAPQDIDKTERPIDDLIDEYEEKRDVLGLLILCLLRTPNPQVDYTKIIKNQRDFVDQGKHDVASLSVDAENSQALEEVARVYEFVGSFSKAEILLKNILQEKVNKFGSIHKDVGRICGKLGLVYIDLGNLKEAENYLNRTIEIMQSVYEKNSCEIAAAYNILASLYQTQGKLKKAEEYYSKHFVIINDISKENYYEVIKTYNNLALLYKQQGKLNKANEYYTKCLLKKKEVYGESHFEVAKTYNNLALLYKQQGKIKDAEDYYTKCLNIKREVYGENHYEVAATYNNLAHLYEIRGGFREAEEYYTKSLNIMKELYGEGHYKAATIYNNLGGLCKQQNKLEQAQEYYNKCLVLRKQVYGEDHYSVATTYNNLGVLYEQQDKFKEAEEYYHKCLIIKTDVYGEDHNELAITYNNLGILYQKQDRLKEAEEYYIKSLNIKKNTYGENHYSIATTYSNLADLYETRGNDKEAEEYYIKSLIINKEAFGEYHCEVAATYNKLSFLYRRQDRITEAEEYYYKWLLLIKDIY